MFKFLKEKVKSIISSMTKKIEEEPVAVPKEDLMPVEEVFKEEPQEKKSFFKKVKETITTKKISEETFENLFESLELALMENNVAVEVIEKIKEDLKMDLVNTPITKSEIKERITKCLKKSIQELFDIPKINLLEKIKNKKPYVICFFGVNGSGKSTTIAKMAYYFKQNGLSAVVSASDTFRAASIEQLEELTKKVDVKLIKHNYGSDAAAVAFDSLSFAKAHDLDVVLIDTAGRLHSNVDLMREMQKIVRVSKPDLKVFVAESIIGNDAVEQAKTFDKEIGIDSIILTKADIDEKGGAALSISYVAKKPIIFFGTGQNYSDLEPFNVKKVIDKLGL